MDTTLNTERAFQIVEHAIDYLSGITYPDPDSALLAIGTLYEAHRAIGPLGQIPSWEAR